MFGPSAPGELAKVSKLRLYITLNSKQSVNLGQSKSRGKNLTRRPGGSNCGEKVEKDGRDEGRKLG